MKKTLAASAVAAALTLAPFAAAAQERAGSTAVGALSGAVVFGPVGAVAGAVVGYTMGPSIVRAWAPNRSEPPRRAKAARSPAEPQGRALAGRPPSPIAARPPAPAARPVQSASKQAAEPIASKQAAEPIASKQAAEPMPAASEKPAVQSVGVPGAMPPAQSFD
jgi:hypothetical protein